MKKRRIHLLCNAHLDPCWLWEWQEGAGEAISTFHTAAVLCEKFEEFIFNHNEAVLYMWVEQYAPELFEQIRRLVAQQRWHIIGGWFLQPDCNMPSGESIIRQILVGRNYFMDKFGVEPKTAMNFDPFGHSRGLVQILAKSGYKHYLFGRPHEEYLSLPEHGFRWIGYDGSEVTGYRFIGWYNAPLGKAREKVEKWIQDHPDHLVGLVLWGVGNHGGGPSHKDCEDLRNLISETQDMEIVHSTPEKFFEELLASSSELPTIERDLNPWAPGCYTSQIRIKQLHRLLENELYSAEKMASICSLLTDIEYPHSALQESLKKLLFAEFHDILPGSSIPPVEEYGLQILHRGLDVVSEIKTRCLFALSRLQNSIPEKSVPLFAFNPHPFPVTQVFETEFCLPDFNFDGTFVNPTLFIGDQRLPTQVEKELSNVGVDWRKRVVFVATLPPSQVTQINCVTKEILPSKPVVIHDTASDSIEIQGEQIQVSISRQTGLLEYYRVDGYTYIHSPAFQLLVLQDYDDAWGSEVRRYDKVVGSFTLLSDGKVPEFCGIQSQTLDPVRIIEDGEVRTVVEALFHYNNSYVVTHYKIPKLTNEIEVALRVFWFEKNKMLKLCIPVPWSDSRYVGQVIFGREDFTQRNDEIVTQKWVGAVSPQSNRAITIINDCIYGSDFTDNVIRLTLLHSPAYSGLPVNDKLCLPQDRFTPRMDLGERSFRFWIQGGEATTRLHCIDNEALAHNEKPMLLSFYPLRRGEPFPPGIILSNPSIVLSAFKKAEKQKGFIIRLFEPTGKRQNTQVTIPALHLTWEVELKPFEIKTFLLDPITKTITETDLIERSL